LQRRGFTVFSFARSLFLLPTFAFFFFSSSAPHKTMVSFLPFTSRSTGATGASAAEGGAPLKAGGDKKASSPSAFLRFKKKAAELSASSSSAPGQMVPGAPLPHIILPVIEVRAKRVL
jgi:hypothetical protein